MSKILVAEDDSSMLVALRDGLQYEGHEVTIAGDGEAALRLADQCEPDLILLDVMLPKRNGISVCRQIRDSGSRVPIIMVSARSQEVDKVTGLRAGADDYITKPFGLLELSARMEAVLRRAAPDLPSSVRFGDVEVDFEAYEVRKAGTPVALSAREFELLGYLVENRGQVVSRKELLTAVWSYDGASNTRTVDMHIAKLRKKIEDDPACPRFIVTQHRVGYRLDI